MQKVNIKQFNKYKNIFGETKMLALWKEFVAQAECFWKQMSHFEWEDKRLLFHNWRSGSQVFGLGEFSACCQQIEENIINHRFAKAEKQAMESKQIYQESLEEINMIFSQMESQDGK
ncbi:MAG: hypothetical protein IKA03_00480 [Alphaproteobacteria bacterium]|nr:hypothetical protein [Alphaproteobacteria bacterium]